MYFLENVNFIKREGKKLFISTVVRNLDLYTEIVLMNTVLPIVDSMLLLKGWMILYICMMCQICCCCSAHYAKIGFHSLKCNVSSG
ncbi:unnamed protein product [Brugia timori]|uniref:Ovule protein n=1 Tax=Brugia timori TaxID=42155 RepID=A0A0R3QFN4_9BILA|nr:unnamed protein product [Brugia timori]